MIHLSECSPKLRERIQKQIEQEDRLGGAVPAGLCADNKQPDQGSALVAASHGETDCWYGLAKRFEIIFRIFAMRPADWDGYHIKELQDMVVHAGILPDDKWSVLRGRIVSEKANSKGEEGTQIEIIPLND